MQKLRIIDEHLVLGFCVIVLLILTWHALNPASMMKPPKTDEVPCVGQPITVSYSYKHKQESPFECKVQCGGNNPRYILYTNGLATQCEEPPGCTDYGEDFDITCVAPVVSK